MAPPVLILAYNRPDLLARTLSPLQAVRPEQLFISVDAPHPDRPESRDEVAEVKEVIEDLVNWPCEIHRMFRSEHLGCRKAVPLAITETFDQVEQLLILEDDCVVSSEFFEFAETMLERHRRDDPVMAISALNLQHGDRRGDGDYYYSKYPHCWGWATWKRAWQHYCDDAEELRSVFDRTYYRESCCSEVERAHWQVVCDWLIHETMESWAIRWMFSCWRRQGLSVIPNANLVDNIGADPRGTHTRNPSQTLTPPVEHLGTFRAPSIMTRDVDADRKVFESHFCPPKSEISTLSARISMLETELAARARERPDPGADQEVSWIEFCARLWRKRFGKP